MAGHSTLELYLFGSPRLVLDGRAFVFANRKLLGLLAFVALQGATSRERLAGLLWSDFDNESARRNLRRELHRLRNSALKEYLVLTEQISFIAAPWCDVSAFGVAQQQGQLDEAVRLYAGEFLAGFELTEATGFMEWVVAKREHFAVAFRKTRLEFAERLEIRGDWRQALAVHLQLLGEDEFQEHLHREVMRLHYLLGEREAALKQFDRCRTMLKTELGLEPLPETLELVASIRAVRSLEPAASKQALVATAVRPSILVGRAQPWAQMEAAWHAKQLILLVGEAGIGKTRLILEFAHSKGVVEVTGGRPGDAITPFATVTRTIENLLEKYPLVVLPDWVRRELSRLAPKLSADSPPPITSLEQRARFSSAFAELIQLTTQDVTTLICDDMQFFDASSLEMAFAATQRFMQLAQKRCIAAFRPNELSRDAAALFETYVENGQAVIIELEPLQEADLLEMISGSQGIKPFLPRLYKSSGGNPFFALEIVRSLLETNGALGLVDQTAQLPIPKNVREVVLRRIKKLNSATRRLLEAACLTTDGFNFETLRGATALSEWEGVEALETAIAARMLEPFSEGYGFVHDLMRSTLTDNLSLERKKLLHRKLAVQLEKQNGAAAQIAYHLEEASQPQPAIVWRVKAAREAAVVYANQDALLQYQKAQNNGATGQELFEIYLEQHKLLIALGLEQKRKDTLDAMKNLALTLPHLQVISQLHFAQYFNQTRQHQKAIDAINHLLKTHPLDEKEQAWAWLERGIGAFRLGELILGKTDLSNALEFQALLEPQILGEIHSCLRVIALYEGDLLTAERHIALEFAVAEQFGSLPGKLGAKTGLARIAMVRGDVLGAVQTLHDSLELAQKIGSTSEQLYAQMWLSYNQIQLGDLEQAEQNISQALGLANQSKDSLSRVRLLLLQTRVHNLGGQFGQAIVQAQLALEESYTVSVAAEIIALHCLAKIMLDIGNVASAKQFYAQGLQLATTSQFSAYFCSFELGLVQCALATSDRPNAKLHFQQAVQTQALAEAHERDDLRLTQAALFLALGQAKQAQTVLEPLRTTIFPENQLRFLALELHICADLNLEPKLPPVFASLENGLSCNANLELRRALIRLLKKDSKQKIQKSTQALALEMAQSLSEFPDFKTLFCQKNADLL